MLQRVSPLLRGQPGARPGFVRPLIPTLVSEPPAGDGWLHEIKHDGYRTILVIKDGRATGFTRNSHNWTDRYRYVCDAAENLLCRSAVLDGEMIVQGENGVSDFDALTASDAAERQAAWSKGLHLQYDPVSQEALPDGFCDLLKRLDDAEWRGR